MIELELLLAMNASEPTPPAVRAIQPAAVSPEAQGRKPRRELSDKERAEVREVVERIARCSTGKLHLDPASGFYVPKMKPDCK